MDNLSYLTFLKQHRPQDYVNVVYVHPDNKNHPVTLNVVSQFQTIQDDGIELVAGQLTTIPYTVKEHTKIPYDRIFWDGPFAAGMAVLASNDVQIVPPRIKVLFDWCELENIQGF